MIYKESTGTNLHVQKMGHTIFIKVLTENFKFLLKMLNFFRTTSIVLSENYYSIINISDIENNNVIFN